jgi:hypothetical protein
MSTLRWTTRSALLGALLLAFAPASDATAQCRSYGGYYGGGTSLRGVGSYRNGSRLLRHRSGYLYGQRPYYPRNSIPYGGYGGYYGGGGPTVIIDGNAGCSTYAADPYQDFDCRRDRLLDAASRLDVSFVHDSPAPAPAPPPVMTTDGKGWTLLREGEPVRALGSFTARLMSTPSDGNARIGFAIAASLYGDDTTAIDAMRAAVRLNPETVRGFEADAEVGLLLRPLVNRYNEAAARQDGPSDDRFMTAALHCLLREYDEARYVLEGGAGPGSARLVAIAISGQEAEAAAAVQQSPREDDVTQADAPEGELLAQRD